MKTCEEALQDLKNTFHDHYTDQNDKSEEGFVSLDEFFQMWHDEITRQYKELDDKRKKTKHHENIQ